MPTTPKTSPRNRDQDSIYRPGQLSKVFAALSTLLVVGWIGMVWKDYARPWRQYQRRYYDTQLQLSDAQTREVKAQISKLEQEIESARQADRAQFDELQKNPEYQRLLGQRYETRRQWETADAHLKGVKGVWAPARYIYETALNKLQQLEWTIELGDKASEQLPAAVEALESARRAQAVAGSGDSSSSQDADATLARAEATVNELRSRVAAAGEARGDVEGAREEMEAARKPFNDLAEQYHAADRDLRLKESAFSDLKARIADLEKPWKKAVSATESRLEPLVKQRNTLEGLSLKYRKNQWRNAPFVDFISPTIKVEQLVLNDIHDNFNIATNRKVDRCITCHLGISNPVMADEAELARHGVTLERYMKAHPGLRLIAGPGSVHEAGRFGCSTCHHGVGWSTDFARAAHTPVTADQKAYWKQEHGWKKPEFVDFPMLAPEYVEGQCFKCHRAGMYYPPHYAENFAHGLIHGVEIVNVEGVDRVRYRGQALFSEDDPRYFTAENRPLAANEVYGDYALPGAPLPTKGSPTEVAASLRRQLVEHYGEVLAVAFSGATQEEADNLRSAWLDTQVTDYRWHAERFERAYDTVTNYGCQGCHKIQDMGQQVGYEQPPRVGPALTYIADKVGEHFLEQWVKHPDFFRPDTRMPSFFYFVNKDANWEFVRDAAGKRQVIPVLNAHQLDPQMWKALGNMFTGEEEAIANVTIKAISTYLLNQRDPVTGRLRSRMGLPPEHPDADPIYNVEPPAGDVEKGRELVNSLGCTACHVVPEIRVLEGGTATYVPDSMERFDYDVLQMRGPRLVGLGSKINNRKWLSAWLANPRHYTDTTRMPDMRIDGERDPLTQQVIRSAEQQRADITDYLLSFRDEELDALEAVPFKKSYERILVHMYEYFYGMDEGGLKPARRISAELGDLSDERRLGTALARVGERMMSRNGCFGCHAVAGHEREQPIGVELTREGIKDLHQLDFGSVPKDVIPHSRPSFFRNKITTPRVYDWGKVKPWFDVLRMPRFNFRMDDPPASATAAERANWPSTRSMVTGLVTGLVEEPILPGAIFKPDEYERDLIAGRRVVQRYGCNNCHTIEGREGLLWGQRMAQDPNSADVPPNLFGQGLRTQSEWLHKFLKNPKYLRPIVNIHMPRFGLSDAEVDALVRYFVRLAGREQSLFIPTPDSGLVGREAQYETGGEPGLTLTAPGGQDIGPVYSAVEEAKLLFEAINCNKCHLPKGWPGVDPSEGGVAPSFEHSPERLRWIWVRTLLDDPKHLISATKMPQAYPLSRTGARSVDPNYQPFQFQLRWDPQWKADMASDDAERRARAETKLARVQMDALVDYLIHHYQPPALPVDGEKR